MIKRSPLQVFLMRLNARISNYLWTFRHPCDACGKRIYFAKSQHGVYDPDWIHTKCLERYCIQEGIVGDVEPYYYEDNDELPRSESILE